MEGFLSQSHCSLTVLALLQDKYLVCGRASILARPAAYTGLTASTSILARPLTGILCTATNSALSCRRVRWLTSWARCRSFGWLWWQIEGEIVSNDSYVTE